MPCLNCQRLTAEVAKLTEERDEWKDCAERRQKWWAKRCAALRGKLSDEIVPRVCPKCDDTDPECFVCLGVGVALSPAVPPTKPCPCGGKDGFCYPACPGVPAPANAEPAKEKPVCGICMKSEIDHPIYEYPCRKKPAPAPDDAAGEPCFDSKPHRCSRPDCCPPAQDRRGEIAWTDTKRKLTQ